MASGLFFAIEGSDGSGKGTQYRLLAERLRAVGYDVDLYDFPRYEEPSSYFVKRYLNGEYGPASEVSPFTASIFFALDRYEVAPKIRQSIADGKIVLANRYTSSNMAHQGSKFTKIGEQRGFFVWAESLEFQLLGIPRPNLNIFLKVPAEISFQLINRKKVRSYTKRSHDEHEADIEHLKKAVAMYQTICKLFPKDYKTIDCSKNGKILSIPEVNNLIWEAIQSLLPKPINKGRSVIVNLSENHTSKLSHNSGEINTSPKTDTKIKLKDISLLATNHLLASGISVSKQVILWPPKNEKARINYYIPSGMSPKITNEYRKIMDTLLMLYMEMYRSIEEYDKNNPDSHVVSKAKKALSNIIPLAALSNMEVDMGLDGSMALLANVIRSDLAEARLHVKNVFRKFKKNLPAKDKDGLYLNKLANSITKNTGLDRLAVHDENVKILEASPRNEVELVADIIYSRSNQGRLEILDALDKISYEQKSDILKKALGQDPHTVLMRTHYRFDVVDTSAVLHELISKIIPTDLRVQLVSPRYGYDVPKSLEVIGIEEDYIECFDLSLQLYSRLQSEKDNSLAGYAVLFGHKLRWQFATDAEAIFKYYPTPSFAFDSLLNTLRSRISEVHPLIGMLEPDAPGSRIISNQAKNNSKTTGIQMSDRPLH